jgi:hypothetical protein
LPPSWQALLPRLAEDRELLGDAEAHLWFSRFDPVADRYVEVRHFDFAPMDASMCAYWSVSSHGFDPGRASHAVRLPMVDWRTERLRFRLVADGVTNDFSLPNPRRHERFPVWPAAPLPQTRVTNGFAFTLAGLDLVSPQDAWWEPRFTVSREDRDVTDWFDLQRHLTDPTGNRAWSRLPAGEPVWRLEVSAYPAARFPFAEGRAISLGRHTLPEEAEHEFVTLDAAATNAGLRAAWLTGPGSFHFRNGTNVSARPPAAGQQGDSSSLGDDRWQVKSDAPHAQLWLILEGPAAGTALLAAETNDAARLLVRLRDAGGGTRGAFSRGHFTTGGTIRRRLASFHLDPAKPGEELELDLLLVEPLRVDFTFPAPQVP